MKFSKYTITARFFPAIITSLPLIILSGFIIGDDYIELFKNLKYLKIAGLATTPVILFYLFAQINRFIAKEYFQKKYFKGEIEMPTTMYLLYSNNQLSNEYKESIRNKIEQEFNLILPTQEDENTNVENSKLRISESIGLVRNKVGAGNLLLQHNIEYGFIRNLIGGSPISFIFSISNIVIFSYFIDSKPAMITSIVLTVFYLTFILLSKFLINRYGEIYAKRLFQEYMT
ncbi:hypothetical protein EMN47_20130 [Prolixibacteraceae bacterium JC049]|nr:hypothetical protein [Prolixibacteraceae bacterium JC049]